MRHALFLMVLGAVAGLAPAQETGFLWGTASDAYTAVPLAQAAVWLSPDSLALGTGTPHLRTDAAGRFEAASLAAGRYFLLIQQPGYHPATDTVTVRAGGIAVRHLPLRPTSPELSRVAFDTLDAVLQRTLWFGPAAMRGGVDVAAVLTQAPGLDAVRRGGLGLDPVVRGLTGFQVATYVDGVRYFAGSPLRADAPLAYVAPAVVQQAEVVRGPYALTQGAGHLSMIRVKTAGPVAAPGWHGQLRSGYATNGKVAQVGGAVGGRQGPLSVAANGSYRRGSEYRDGDGRTVPAGFAATTGRVHLGYALRPSLRLLAHGGFAHLTEVDAPGTPLDLREAEGRDAALRLQWARAYGLVQSLDARVYHHRLDTQHDNRHRPTARADTNRAWPMPFAWFLTAEQRTTGGRVAAHLAPSPTTGVDLGADLFLLRRDAVQAIRDTEVDTLLVPRSPVWPDASLRDLGVFAHGTAQIEVIRLSGSARLDFVRAKARTASTFYLENARPDTLTVDDLTASQVFVSMALGAAYPFAAGWTVSMHIGSAVRTSDVLERYSDRFPNPQMRTPAEFIANPFKEPERTLETELALAGRTALARFAFSLFARQIRDYSSLAAQRRAFSQVLAISPDTSFRYTSGQAQHFGIEASLDYDLAGPMQLHLAGHYLTGRDVVPDEPALGVPPARLDVGLTFVQRRFEVTAQLRAVAKHRDVATSRGEVPTDGYATLGLALQAAPLPGISLRLGVDNLLGLDYERAVNGYDPYTGQPLHEPGRSFWAYAAWAF